MFDGRRSTSVLVAPPTVRDTQADTEADIPMSVALANAAPLAAPEPMTALTQAPAAEAPDVKAAAPKPAPKKAPLPARPAPSAETVKTLQAPVAAATPPPESLTQPPSAQPTVNTQLPGTGQKKYTGNPISMDFQDADLRSVLRTFAEISGLNMVIDPQVQGRVDMVLNEVPWDQALDTILRGNKLGWTVDGTIVRIAPLAVLADEQADQRKLTDAKALAGELRVQTFALSYAKAGDLSQLLTKIGAVAARSDSDRRTDEHAHHHRPARSAADRGHADRHARQSRAAGRGRSACCPDHARLRARDRHPVGAQRARSPEIGNTTPLAFPNNGSLGGRVGGTQRGTGFTQGPTDRAAARSQNTA